MILLAKTHAWPRLKNGLHHNSSNLSKPGAIVKRKRPKAEGWTGSLDNLEAFLPHPTSTKKIEVTMSEDVKTEIERLRAENESLKNKKSTEGSLSMKVSEKGALSIYGMGRFPVTLYKEQWLKLLGIADQIKKYIEENNSRLKTKE
jgi:hypothetical protein